MRKVGMWKVKRTDCGFFMRKMGISNANKNLNKENQMVSGLNIILQIKNLLRENTLMDKNLALGKIMIREEMFCQKLFLKMVRK